MKKIISLIIALFCCTLCCVGCGANNKEYFTVYAPDGAPAVAIAKFISEKEKFGSEKEFRYNVVTAAEISGAITVNKADFVIMPIAAATKLYKQNGGYKMAAVITHGNFYFISSFKIESAEGLVGKCVLIPNAQNTVPDLTLKSILKEKNIEYTVSDTAIANKVALCYYNSGSTVIQKLSPTGSDEFVAMLPEPAATSVASVKPVYSYRLDMQAQYDSENKSYPQAVLMVKASVANDYGDIISNMAGAFASNAAWVKNNPQKAVAAVKAIFNGSSLTNLTEKSIDGCKIYWGGAQYEKQAVLSYITRIRAVSEASVNEVSDDFFL